MTAPADRPPWSAIRHRNDAGRPSAPPPGRGPARRTPQSLRQDGWRSPHRSRDPSAENERGPTGDTRRSAVVSSGIVRDFQKPFDDARRTLPLRFFLLELLAPGACQCVELHAAAALGCAPSGRDPPHLLQPEQRRIQRALVERQLIPADLFDSPRDSISVQRAQGLQCLDDHQAEGPVEDVTLVGRHMLGAYTSQLLAVNRSWSTFADLSRVTSLLPCLPVGYDYADD